MTRGFLKDILRLSATVYSFKEFVLLWPNVDAATIKSRLNYYVKHNDLHHIRRGLYAKDMNYNRFELAVKIYTPAYISFETVLKDAGIIFQYYSQIFVATYQAKTVVCDGQEYVFRRLQPTILLNSIGIEQQEYYSIATPERAFLDMLYIKNDYYFDSLAVLDWKLVFNMVHLYDNKSLEQRVQTLYKATLEDV